MLEGLTRHGVTLSSACRAGACHACLLQAPAGDPGEASQRGLKPALRAQGYFLACLARPAAGLTVAAGQAGVTPATLVSRRWLSADVLAIWLQPAQPVPFRPGQHVTLDRGDGVARTYSIANLPAEAAAEGLEFHLRVHERGAMSAWFARAALGATVKMGPPAGECFYLPGEPDTSLLLAGTGTGIAPLLAVARDALSQGHHGPVAIVHGASRPGRLYLGEDLPARLCGPAAASIRWRPCARSRGQQVADAVLAELAALKDPAATRAYLCGGAGSVTAMRRALFLAGMSLRDLCADTFLPAAARLSVPGRRPRSAGRAHR